jgi:Mg2+-importing ATPase
VLTGDEMRSLTHPALVARARRTTIFARVDPDQKLQVIRALHDSGAVVGYLGDGINDAPALHTADVGISVDNATTWRAPRPTSSCSSRAWRRSAGA